MNQKVRIKLTKCKNEDYTEHSGCEITSQLMEGFIMLRLVKKVAIFTLIAMTLGNILQAYAGAGLVCLDASFPAKSFQWGRAGFEGEIRFFGTDSAFLVSKAILPEGPEGLQYPERNPLDVRCEDIVQVCTHEHGSNYRFVAANINGPVLLPIVLLYPGNNLHVCPYQNESTQRKAR